MRFIKFLFLLIFLPNLAFGATQGPLHPGTVVDDNSIGTAAWANPSNAVSSNNSYAIANASSAVTHYLKATNFGFTTTGTINGIQVCIERKQDDSSCDALDDNVKLVVGGSIVGNNKASAVQWSDTSDRSDCFGGAADLWGLTPTAAQVNGSTFGVVVNAHTTCGNNLYIDDFTITITYTPAASIVYTKDRASPEPAT